VTIAIAFIVGVAFGRAPVHRVLRLLALAESFSPPHSEVTVRDVRMAIDGRSAR